MNARNPFAAAGGDLDQREALLNRECAGRRRVRFLECAVLVAVGLVVLELAWHYPSSRHASSWREKDWLIWHHAHQLFRRDPEELTESELEDVRQWCRCLALIDRYNKTGLNKSPTPSSTLGWPCSLARRRWRRSTCVIPR